MVVLCWSNSASDDHCTRIAKTQLECGKRKIVTPTSKEIYRCGDIPIGF